MVEDQVLVEVKVSRSKKEIVYSVNCSIELTNEELEYYLGEVIKGICSWKPGVCEGNVKSFNGKISKNRKPKGT
jgi:hypothetical protein